MELKDVFGAEPKSTWQVLCERGTGFYIPAYQRDYTWEEDKIDRLLEDSLHGLRKLVDNEDAITFLGTLIVIHDTKYQTVEPHVRGHLPGRVLVVIDGQQRLTTLLLLFTCLHEDLSARLAKIKDDQRPAFEWLSNQTRVLINQLDTTFREDMSYGKGIFRWYPRMIRAFVDSWSRENTTAKYTAPISAYLHSYSSYITNETKGKFDYQMPATTSSDEKGNHDFLNRNRRIIRRNLDGIARGNDEDLELPPLEQIADKTTFQETLLKAEFPPDVITQLSGTAEGTAKDKDRFNELMRLVLFGKFMLERVAVTVVTAKNEDYAFDMFEALNTTGEPLTAFETCRPKVIEAETLQKYEDSISHQSMKLVEGYLDEYSGAEDKHKATSRLLIPFALAESGEKLSKRLSDQRRYLKDSFDRLGSANDKREFVKHLAHTAMFLRHLWPDDRNGIPELPDAKFPNQSLTLLCLDVLRAANHHITIGPLTRFFSQSRSAGVDQLPSTLLEFQEGILAVTAFFALWRSSRIGTDKIDSHYRDILRFGVEGAGIDPFARRPQKGLAQVPSAEKLRAAFLHILMDKGGIVSKDEWVRLASQTPVYKNSIPLARFLLYVATHDTAPDSANPGLVKAGRVGSLNILTIEQWKDKLTVEHVAPQKRLMAGGWDSALYEVDDTINRLGNLTLAPGIENASLGNRPWAVKRLMYRVLGSPTVDDLDQRIEEAQQQGIDLSKDTAEILRLAKFLPHVRAIGDVDGEWTTDIVAARSKRLAELAWVRLSSWLGMTA
jgi:hypothetical protein